jgi:hypothetical protein
MMGPGWLNEFGSWIYLRTRISLPPIRRGFAPGFVKYKKGALDSVKFKTKYIIFILGV